MRVWINFWPAFQKLRHALAKGHLAIILQGGNKFQSAFGINARNARLRIELRVPDRSYSGVGEGDEEPGCASDDSAVGDALALIFFLLSAERAFNDERSRTRD